MRHATVRYTAAAFRLVLLSYSVVSDAALQLVSCHSPLGESVMVSQPSVACWTGHHTIWGVVSWLLVVFWVIGLPVAIVAFLWVVKQGYVRQLATPHWYTLTRAF